MTVLSRTFQQYLAAAAIVFSCVCLAIRRNKKVVYIVDTPSAETIIEYTRDDGAEVESAFRGEQLSMITQADAYVRDGVFDREAVIALLDSRIPKAVADGCQGTSAGR